MAAALAVGLLGLVLIAVVQRLVPKLPAVKGFPPPTLPSVPLSDMALLVAGAVGIAVVSLTDTISTASVFAARAGQEVDGTGR